MAAVIRELRRLSVGILLVATSVLVGCGAGAASADDVKLAEGEYGLANDAFRRGELREALDRIQRALEHDDANADAHYLGAMIMLMFCAQDEKSPDCRYPEAETFLRAALAAEPDMRDAKNALGVVLVHRGRPKEAVKVLKPLSGDILYRSPEKAWGNLGWAYLEAGDIDDAVQALKRSVAAQPSFCVGHYRLGVAFEQKKDYAAARQSYTRALSVEKGACERLQVAYLGRARVLQKLGQRAKAGKDLKRCHALKEISPVGRKCRRKLQALQ
jgi:Tfp pilus assembly protein PilF